jgi:hypothetical protein
LWYVYIYIFSLLCKAKTLDPKKVRGKILVCLRGDNARVEKSYHAHEAGAVGMILANDKDNLNDIQADFHFLPTSHLSYADGQQVFAYIKTTKYFFHLILQLEIICSNLHMLIIVDLYFNRNPFAFITHVRTQLGIKPSPYVASFSSRGPNLIDFGILKVC